MSYFSYHATVRKLLSEGKLIGYYFSENHNGIKPALVLLFADDRHPVMPVREYRWAEYAPLLSPKLLLGDNRLNEIKREPD